MLYLLVNFCKDAWPCIGCKVYRIPRISSQGGEIRSDSSSIIFYLDAHLVDDVFLRNFQAGEL